MQSTGSALLETVQPRDRDRFNCEGHFKGTKRLFQQEAHTSTERMVDYIPSASRPGTQLQIILHSSRKEGGRDASNMYGKAPPDLTQRTIAGRVVTATAYEFLRLARLRVQQHAATRSGSFV